MNKKVYLETVAKKCMEELDSLNIPYNKPMSWEVNKQAKTRWGQCRKRLGFYHININEELIDPSYLVGLKETILHELLHTINGCMNHGTKWKNYAKQVNEAYGYNISRCSGREKLGLAEVTKEDILTSAKYVIVCTKCGTITTRNRMSNLIKYTANYACKCGGELRREK